MFSLQLNIKTVFISNKLFKKHLFLILNNILLIEKNLKVNKTKFIILKNDKLIIIKFKIYIMRIIEVYFYYYIILIKFYYNSDIL